MRVQRVKHNRRVEGRRQGTASSLRNHPDRPHGLRCARGTESPGASDIFFLTDEDTWPGKGVS